MQGKCPKCGSTTDLVLEETKIDTAEEIAIYRHYCNRCNSFVVEYYDLVYSGSDVE